MDLNFYSDLTDGSGQHGDPEFLDPQTFNGFDSVHKFPGGSDSYLTIPGSGLPFLPSSETFHTPSLGDEEFEIPPISLDPDSSLTVSDVVSHFGELSDTGPSDTGNAVVGGDDPSFASTFVNPASQGLEHLSLHGVISQPGGGAMLGSGLGMDLGHPIGSQFSSSSPMTIDVPLSDMGHSLLGTNQLTTIDQSELSAQLGLGLGGGSILHRSQSPEHPLSATASPTSSLQDDDMDDFRRVRLETGAYRHYRLSEEEALYVQNHCLFRKWNKETDNKSVLVESPISLAISLDPSLTDSPVPVPTARVSAGTGRKGGGGRGGGTKGRKPKKDPNEPQKPVSAYALFFRDTQAAIKGQNPHATFGEVSKIVASMWDSLGEEQKQVYKRKNEAAKREYLKNLAAYRANQMSQAPIEVLDTTPSPPPPAPAPITSSAPSSSSFASRPSRTQQYNPEENTITNICTSNIILDLPGRTTRSRTGATKPAPPPLLPPSPPTVTKIIIKRAPSPSGGVTVTATAAPSSRQPPPLQQMQNTPPPPRLQQMVHGQAPPPLQAKPRGGGGGASSASSAPPPLQIKFVPVKKEASAIIVASAGEAAVATSVTSTASPSSLAMEVERPGGGMAAAEEVADGEEGMEVEVNVAPGPGMAPAPTHNVCVRAGCTNAAVESKDWDNEYCSNECVATHCRDVFMAWCAIRGQSTTVT